MTITEEARELRARLVKLRPGRGKRYPPLLRQRVLDWVERAKESGLLEYDCQKLLGIPQHRFELWRQSFRRQEPEPKALVQIEVKDETPVVAPTSVAFVSPLGYRIEGLTVAQAVTLFRSFG